ncbi:unnamed protein product [Pocillopora meandrina]|uniref:Uncharacterized protein n=1 Tax=Pocillopora meandrina TaxID=46732 RepID=A0AAU9VRN9_9CNID|nr:unnamed protein product [Pocillopora meandrina]
MTALLNPPGRFVAQQRKKVHDSSAHIYPSSRKSDDMNRAITSYVIDFAKKEGKPALPRPCSATRRNRPHPSQNFLNWRIPSRPLTGPKTSNADEAFLNLSVLETKERFYDDYVGSFSKCASLLDERLKRVLCSSLTTFLKRSYCRWNSGCLRPLIRTMRPLCISKDAGNEYDSLVSRAPTKEKNIIESCLDAGDIGYMGRNFGHVVRPEAIPAIHQWLKFQDETDRDVVFRFLNKLKRNSSCRQDWEMDQKSCKLPNCIDKNRTAELSRAGRNAISDHIRQKLSKDKQAVKCPTLTRSKKSKGRSMNATGDFITNKSAVFMQPHRRLPSHFEIHPEFHYVPAK